MKKSESYPVKSQYNVRRFKQSNSLCGENYLIHSSTEIHAVYLSLPLLQICFPMRVNVLTTRGILRDDVGDLTG